MKTAIKIFKEVIHYNETLVIFEDEMYLKCNLTEFRNYFQNLPFQKTYWI